MVQVRALLRHLFSGCYMHQNNLLDPHGIQEAHNMPDTKARFLAQCHVLCHAVRARSPRGTRRKRSYFEDLYASKDKFTKAFERNLL